jgi:hypothetical protein
VFANRPRAFWITLQAAQVGKHANMIEVATMEAEREEPLLLTAQEAAAMLKVELRTWRTWHASGRIPEPIRIGRKTFWRPEILRAWVAAGCPDRATWAVMRE